MGQAQSQDQKEKLEMMDAKMVIDYDVDAKGRTEPGESERVIVAAWENAMDIALKNGVGMARTVPWNADRGGEENGNDQKDTNSSGIGICGKIVGGVNDGMLSKIFESSVIGDSYASASDIVNGGNASDTSPICKNSQANDREAPQAKHLQRRKKQEPFLSGKPIHPTYVDRYLPGIVNRHWWDGHPTNGVIWSRHKLDRDDFDPMVFLETARRHPGDNPDDDFLVGVAETIYARSIAEAQKASKYDEKMYQPILTKAGSRLWGISFAAPKQSEDIRISCDDGSSLTELRASYPGQLLVRLDKARGLLMYDCFEFVPISLDKFHQMEMDPVTNEELEAIERLLRKTKPRRDFDMRNIRLVLRNIGRREGALLGEDILRLADSDSEDDEDENELLDPSESVSKRWRHIGMTKVHYILNWLKFKKSRVFRARFPVDSIVGARLLIFDYKRPNADSLPPPEGECQTSQLGEYGNEESGERLGDRALHGTLEHFDETIEPLGVLVLELSQCGKDCDPYNRPTFASSILWPGSRRFRTRAPLDRDWTPNEAFSRSNRHYIIGDASEMKELANAMMKAFPRIKILLSPQSQVKGNSQGANADSEFHQSEIEEALMHANSLFGSYQKLHPSNPPPSVQSLRSQISISILEKAKILKPSAPPSKPPIKLDGFASKNEVDEFLSRCGVKEPEYVNKCLKAGLLNGNLKVPHHLKESKDPSEFLDTVLAIGKCGTCDRNISCTVRMALNQAELGSYGDGYESDAAVNCGDRDDCNNECDGTYITGLCSGTPKFTSGKYHHHCEICPNWGQCIGDCRNEHCYHCGEHYFSGYSGFPCSCGGNPDDIELDTDAEGEEDTGELRHDDLAKFVAPPEEGCWNGYVHDSPLDDVREAFMDDSESWEGSDSWGEDDSSDDRVIVRVKMKSRMMVRSRKEIMIVRSKQLFGVSGMSH